MEEKRAEKAYTEMQIGIAGVLLGIRLWREAQAVTVKGMSLGDAFSSVEEMSVSAVENVKRSLATEKVPNFPDGIPDDLINEICVILNELAFRGPV